MTEDAVLKFLGVIVGVLVGSTILAIRFDLKDIHTDWRFFLLILPYFVINVATSSLLPNVPSFERGLVAGLLCAVLNAVVVGKKKPNTRSFALAAGASELAPVV